jgi:hypothetical protein
LPCPVVLEPFAFSSLLMSAIEIHGRESLGFLIGHHDRQFINGRMTDCISRSLPRAECGQRKDNGGLRKSRGSEES